MDCLVLRQMMDGAEALSQAQDADGVLESCVNGAGENQMVEPQLLASAQRLKEWGVYEPLEMRYVNRRYAWYADGAVHRVDS